MDPLYRYKHIIDDRPDKIKFTQASIRQLDEYGLCMLDVAIFLNKENCLRAFEAPKTKPLVTKEGFTYTEHLIFENEKIFKKAFSRCKRAKDNGWIEQKKLFRGVYFQEDIERKNHPKIEINWIGDDLGYGVFAAEPILEHKFIGEYVGVVRKKPFFTKENYYTMRYPTLFLGRREMMIDGETMGNFTRFINHSAKPNLELESVFISPFTRMIFTAKRKIEPFEQLTFDYGKLYWKKRKFKDI